MPHDSVPPDASFDLDEKVLAMMRGRRVPVPPYPAVAVKLQEVTARKSFAISDVVDVVSADQALTATVLRAANSVLFSTLGAATTLQQAAARLGGSEVARLALAAGLSDTMKAPGSLQSLRRQAWAEGVASAAVSHALARQRGLSQRDAFTCGLLHDFGRIVGIACLEQVLLANPGIASRSEESFRATLDRVVPEMGALIASSWNLPPLLQQGMTLRTEAEWSKSAYAPILEVVALSDAVVAMLTQTSHIEALDLATIPGLRPSELEPLAEMLPGIPVTIAAFEVEQPPKPIASKLSLPQTTLGNEPLRPLTLEVQQLQPVHRGPFVMMGINANGWTMAADQSLPERQILEVTLSTGSARASVPSTMKLWASTSLCVAEDGGGYRIECKPFALDREGKRRWAELVASARPHLA